MGKERKGKKNAKKKKLKFKIMISCAPLNSRHLKGGRAEIRFVMGSGRVWSI